MLALRSDSASEESAATTTSSSSETPPKGSSFLPIFPPCSVVRRGSRTGRSPSSVLWSALLLTCSSSLGLSSDSALGEVFVPNKLTFWVFYASEIRHDPKVHPARLHLTTAARLPHRPHSYLCVTLYSGPIATRPRSLFFDSRICIIAFHLVA